MNKTITVDSNTFDSIDTIVQFINDPNYIIGITKEVSKEKNSFVGIVLQPGISGATIGTKTHFTKEYFEPTDYSITTRV